MTTAAGPADFHPTHVVPREGLPAWEEPDVSRPTAALDPFLPVRLLSRRGEWGEVLCANGWSAWVDGRLLVPVPEPPPAAGRPRLRAEDPLPLLARTAEALERYRRAAGELASERTEAEAFRSATRGLRAGIVIDGESVWLYEEASGRWMYGDGTGLVTYAVDEGPGTPAQPPRPQQQRSDPEPSDPEPSDPEPSDPEPSEPEPVESGTAGSGRPEPAAGHEPTRIVTPPEDGGR
ncbi:hypothetical protein EDE04_6020 [Streptomyces sp. 2132.2]|uniref:hypothetical protein n=1 Tax=Streptomyces sp. 2132.2 TaxID=2485161 RepID=UPI000F960FAE|nr:hypothetical protein [Streptomyces sp. 2132.2]ROQ99466.1 hypothetical protein EDE04_6020 [Streptomyces sp. 2132.2]